MVLHKPISLRIRQPVNQPLQNTGQISANDPIQMTANQGGFWQGGFMSGVFLSGGFCPDTRSPELRIKNRPMNLNVPCGFKNEMNEKICDHCFLSAMTSLIFF